MQEGFILEASPGVRMASEWIAGAPEPGGLMGLHVKGKEKRPIQTFRCSKCGYLESYA